MLSVSFLSASYVEREKITWWLHDSGKWRKDLTWVCCHYKLERDRSGFGTLCDITNCLFNKFVLTHYQNIETNKRTDCSQLWDVFLTKSEESVRCRALCDITKSFFSELDDLVQSFGQLEQEEVKCGIFSFLWVHAQAKEADHLKY